MSFSVTRILRYPVKSMQGEALERAAIGTGGVALDRGWALKDEETGNILGAKREGALLLCSARYLPGTDAGSVPHVQIELPTGESVRSDDPGAPRRISDFLDREVSLWPLQPREDEEHYRLRLEPDVDMDREMREMFALEPDEGLPDLTKFPPDVLNEVMAYASPRGTYFDAFPMNILTEASLRYLSDLMPETRIGIERFRPNIVVGDDDIRCEPVEFGWVGKSLSIGGASMDIVMECPRCVMVTREQPGYEKASGIMRKLVRETDHNLSVYANVSRGGIVAVGDVVAVG